MKLTTRRITPSQMPRLRAELLANLVAARRAGQRYGAAAARASEMSPSRANRDARRPVRERYSVGGADAARAVLTGTSEIWDIEAAVREGVLWWVAPQMTSLAAAAASALPEWSPQVAMPHPTGLIVWDGPTGVEVPAPGAPRRRWRATAFGTVEPPTVPVRAVAWWAARAGVAFTAYTDDPELRAEEDGQPALVAASVHTDTLRWEQPAPGSPHPVTALLGTTWLLASQPGIGDQRALPDARASRGGPAPAAAVTIVTLREIPRPHDEHDGEHDDRQHHHQWVVRGHWRQQPCGPGSAQRRPTWVRPHIKGPEGAPLLERETVHVWRR